MDDALQVLILIARPAAGKSEVIHYLKALSLQERRERFHIGFMDEIDDFPMLWAWFEEDDLLTRMGKPRLHSRADGYFLWPHLWDLLIQRISLEYNKRRRDLASKPQPVTTLIEFSRGREHGGYRQAFQNLSPDILSGAAILYIQVSYAESCRKNRKRFNPARPDSILEHGLSDDKMQRLYGETDWEELSGGRLNGWIEIQGISVPFVVFENEDDVTTTGGEALGERLQKSLATLWRIRTAGS